MMDIAIVAPSPVPFVMGGAESLFLGLQRHINGSTPHHCELIKLPSPEADFRSVVASYEAFAALDLSHFDVVISTKYPAWMIRHPAQTVYLQHKLRGLYDTYDLTGLPTRASSSPWIERIRAVMREVRAAASPYDRLPALFDALRDLPLSDPEAMKFPGPFAREIVHFLDEVGLAPDRVRAYAAISATVRRRENYFPAGREVSVCHHPSGLAGFRSGGEEYLFTASRLDGAKRVALLIDAMRFVRADVPLLIAGTGPDEELLKRRAAGDPRIRFLGFVNDDRLLDLYADALAVLYVPYQEDYGLVTIEAMMSAKPVLTATDSGGVNEFVRNGETGYSVPPEPGAIADRIDHLVANREEGRRMGSAGRRIAETVTWDRVVDTLVCAPDGRRRVQGSAPRRAPRAKLVVATSFPVYPPRGGGQSRIFHLYRALARELDVQIVSLAAAHEPESSREISPGLVEVRVPKSAEHEARERGLSGAAGNQPVTDVALPLLHALTPGYGRALAHAADGARAVIASHPYAVDALRLAAPAVPLWYEAHNVELDLKRTILGSYSGAVPLIAATERTEGECWRSAELVFGCSARDLERLGTLHGATRAELLEVPNGVDPAATRFVTPEERASLKRRLDLGDRPVAIFLGSWHQPNIDAAEHLVRAAERVPGVVFLIVGGAGGPFEYALPPGNVVITGVVEEEEKNLLMGCADLAVNPMISGSGTNLKMLDYFAAGTPVLSTPMGARGLAVVPGEHLFVADIDEFESRIVSLLTGDPARLARVASNARSLAAGPYAWSTIADRFLSALDERLGVRLVAAEALR